MVGYGVGIRVGSVVLETVGYGVGTRVGGGAGEGLGWVVAVSESEIGWDGDGLAAVSSCFLFRRSRTSISSGSINLKVCS